MSSLALLLAPLALAQAAPDAVPPDEHSPSFFSEADWRPAARIWSLKVARKAQSLYDFGPLRRGLQGRFMIRFEIGADGQTRNCIVETSSGSAELDAIGCIALSRAGLAPVMLDENGIPQVKEVFLPMRFVIEDDFVGEPEEG